VLWLRLGCSRGERLEAESEHGKLSDLVDVDLALGSERPRVVDFDLGTEIRRQLEPASEDLGIQQM
jgi:hypothetical protein